MALARLSAHGIAGLLLTLDGLRRGAAIAERARTARYAALSQACAEAGILHLLLGHHAGDQAETVLLRLQARSHAAGLAAMAAVSETRDVRLLRPLLAIPPVRLRDTLRAAGLAWAEDPSNLDPAATRARLRTLRRDVDGAGPATTALVAAAAARGAARATADRETAEIFAECVRFHPEGFAVISTSALPVAALAAAIRLIGGAERAPAEGRLAWLAAALQPATIGGVRLLPAGRLAPGGWVVAREAAAMAAPVPAHRGAVWDGRFRLLAHIPDATLGPLGANAARFAARRLLPVAVLRTLPAIRRGGALVAAPHLQDSPVDGRPLGHRSQTTWKVLPDILWSPPLPAAGAPFAPGRAECYARGC